MQVQAKGDGKFNLNQQGGGNVISVDIDSIDYETLKIIIPSDGNYEVQFTTNQGAEVCRLELGVYNEIVLPFEYQICGETYEAENLGATPYVNENNIPLQAFELNTADHSTADGIYIIEVGDYTSEPIYINNQTCKKKIAYKVNSWRSCSMRGYTYVLWLDYKLDVRPDGEVSISNQQNRDVVVDEYLEFGRVLNIRDIIPYYIAELLRIAFSFDSVKVNDNPYTMTETPSYDLIDEKSFYHGFSINLRKPSECKDHGEFEFTCADGVAIVTDPNGVELANENIPSGEQVIIEVETTGVCPPCDPALVTLNGDSFLTIPSDGSENVTLIDEDSNPVTPISVDGAEITLPNSGGSGGWERPSDWLPMPTVTEDDNVLYALYLVFENEYNEMTLRYVGTNGTVDWGDGTSGTFGNTLVSKVYDYSAISGSVFVDAERGNYKQVMIEVVPDVQNNNRQLFLDQNSGVNNGGEVHI